MYLYLWMYGLCRVYEGVLPGNKLLGFASDFFSLKPRVTRGASIFRSKRLTPQSKRWVKTNRLGHSAFFSRYQKMFGSGCVFFVKQNCFPQTKINWTKTARAIMLFVQRQPGTVFTGNWSGFNFRKCPRAAAPILHSNRMGLLGGFPNHGNVHDQFLKPFTDHVYRRA